MEIISSNKTPGVSDEVKDVIEKYDMAKDSRQAYERRWLKNYMLARNYRRKSAYPWRSNVFIPMIFSIIQDQIPMFTESIFAGSPMIAATALDMTGEDNHKNVEDVLTWDIKLSRFRYKFPSMLLQYLIFGTLLAKVPYRFDTYKGEIVFDGPDIQLMDCLSFYPDPLATATQDMRYWIHRKEYGDLETLKAEGIAAKYKNLDKIRDGQGTGGQTETDYRAEKLSSVGLSYNDTAQNAKKIEVLEIHNLLENTIMAVANKSIIIREKEEQRFKTKGIAIARNYEMPDEFWGMGEPEYLEAMQHALNSKVNQGIDNGEWANNQGIMAEEDVLVRNGGMLMTQPGMILTVKQIDKVRELPFSKAPRSGTMEEEQQLMNWMKIASSGEHSLSPPRSKKTATETNYMAQKEVGRIGHKLFLVESFVKDVAEMFLELRKAFLGSGMNILKEDDQTGQRYVWVLKEGDLDGKFDLEPMGSKVAATKDKQEAYAAMLLKDFRGDPDIDQRELKKRVLQKRGEKDIPGLMTKPAEQIPGQTQQAAPGLPAPQMPSPEMQPEPEMAGMAGGF